MEAPVLNKSRIAKNTGILYIRMLAMMFVSLFTSRITLEALGVSDFGVFNVVGGTIGMLSILTSALSSAVSRFTTYELGKKGQRLALIFSSSLTIQIGLSIFVVIVAETIGLWFVNSELNIPAESMSAANFVYQISILTFVLGLLSVPYSAQIIAYERMSVYAWMSILDIIGKLGISYLILCMPDNRLKWFSGLWGALGIVNFIIIRWYCHKHFEETKYRFIWNKQLLKEMFGFAGWNIIGSTAAILRDQGGNIVINMFFGPAVNAARGIAIQVSTQVQSFSGNFTMALNPQITKSYAMGEKDYTNSLISQGARFSFFLVLIFALPILFNTPYILNWWLTTVPPDATIFIQLVLIFGLVETLSRPLITLMLATGKIKWYQIVVGSLQLLNVPLSYIWLYWGGDAFCVIIVAIATSIICLMARLIMLNRMIGYSIANYFKNVCAKVMIVSGLSVMASFVISQITVSSFLQLLLVSAGISISTILISLHFGCTERERQKIIGFMKKKIYMVLPVLSRRIND